MSLQEIGTVTKRERERKSNRERETVSVCEYERINAFFYSCTIIE